MSLYLSDLLILLALCLFLSTLFITIKGMEVKDPNIEGNPVMRLILSNPEIGYPILVIMTTGWFIGYLYLRETNPRYALLFALSFLIVYGLVFINDFTKAGIYLLEHG